MFHFLHTVGVKHFDLVHDVLIHDAVHIGEGDAVPRCEGGQLAEMALVVVRRNDQIIGAGRAELAAGGDLQAGVAPLAHHRQVNADGGDGDLAHIFVAIDLHHRELGVQGAALCLRFRGLHLLLKVGHHGSSTSTSRAFLTAASPEYAVISCGMGNSYGHPHIETLDRLKGAGVKVYRTDLQGDIIMTCDGENITVNAEPSEAGGASSGESKSETTKSTTTTKITNTTVTEKPAEENPVSYSYVLNTNTMKIHRASCSSVSRMSEENKGYTNDYDGAIAQGYVPCKKCKP